jgi:hypothetical protein
MFEFKGHSAYYQNMRIKFFVKLEQNNELFLGCLGPFTNIHTVF